MKAILILALALTLQAEQCNLDRIDLIEKYHYFYTSTMNKNSLYQKYAMEDIIKILGKMEKSCGYTRQMKQDIALRKGKMQSALEDFGKTDPYRNFKK